MTNLDDLADRYVDEFAALDPCRAAMMGIAGQESALTDYSPDGHAARAGLAHRTLTELDAVTVTTDAERVAAAVLRERLEVDLARDAAGIPDALLSTIDGPVEHLQNSIELLDRGDTTPLEALRTRIQGVPKALAGLRTSLTRAQQEGRIAARLQVINSARQCEQSAAYIADLGKRYDGVDTEAPSAALENFATFLTTELAPKAPDGNALGRDRYALEVRNHLGARIDLEETYAWGWEELARVKSEMNATAEKILPGKPLPEVITALDADPAYRITDAGTFREWMQELADEAIANLHDVHFDIPEPLRKVDCRIPATGGGIYYLSPAEDLSRPGTVWWAFPKEPGGMRTWHVPATMFHEGVPGHHLQIGITVLNTERLNRFQRICGELHPGHVEGWALYAERLMAELGYYRDPAHYLGMLADGQQARAARIILDIGMHLELKIPEGAGFHEGQQWTRQRGVEFLSQHMVADNTHIEFEIDRYLGTPAQAIAYKVGERVWREARETASKKPGFTLKIFHQQALNLGPMGLDQLRKELASPK